MGVVVTIAGGGDWLFVSLFSGPFAVQNQAERTKRSRQCLP